jgi:hypothetical protein
MMVLAAMMAGWVVSHAAAATLEGVTLPDTYMVNGRSLPLNGMGVRTLTIFRIRAYVAALYLAKPSHDAAEILASREPKVLVLQFIHSGSKAQVEKEYREGEANNCGKGACAPTDQADFERLVAAAPAVSPGDQSIFVFTGNGLKVFANDTMIGDYANPDLAYHMLAGFIGQHPPSEALRSGLLGLPPD